MNDVDPDRLVCDQCDGDPNATIVGLRELVDHLRAQWRAAEDRERQLRHELRRERGLE
jgi:hypothetical protein